MTPLEILSLAVVIILLAVIWVLSALVRIEREDRKYWQEQASKPRPRWYDVSSESLKN